MNKTILTLFLLATVPAMVFAGPDSREGRAPKTKASVEDLCCEGCLSIRQGRKDRSEVKCGPGCECYKCRATESCCDDCPSVKKARKDRSKVKCCPTCGRPEKPQGVKKDRPRRDGDDGEVRRERPRRDGDDGEVRRERPRRDGDDGEVRRERPRRDGDDGEVRRERPRRDGDDGEVRREKIRKARAEKLAKKAAKRAPVETDDDCED